MAGNKGWAMGVAAIAASMIVAQGACAGAKPLKRPIGGTQAPSTQWTLVDLGTLGGSGSYANAVTDGGLVVGCSDVAGAGIHAFAWQAGAMRDLGTGTMSADGNSCAYAANDGGAVAGRAASGELVVWKDGDVTHLGIQGSVGGINASGFVAGSYNDGTLTHAFLWRDGALQDLGNLGTDASTVSAANAINARGEVVGNSNNHAFVFENGKMRDLGTLGGASSIAKGVSDAGVIVGMAADANNVPTPFVYSGVMRALPGPGYSSAIAVNVHGQIVGSAEGTYGYLLDGNTVTRLDTIPAVVAQGWRHLEPSGINERGWIAGTATTPTGDLRAFLLLPPGQ
jgi:probable HAF family extracellular repeat protein